MEAWAGSRFRLSLFLLTLVLLVLAYVSARAPRRGASVYLLLGVVAVFAANALVPHIAGALLLRAYVPGVATAVLVVLPVAFWVYLSTIRDDHATRRGGLIAAVSGIGMYAAMVTLVIRP